MATAAGCNNLTANTTWPTDREQMKKRCARATSSPGWKLLKFYQHGEGMLSQMAYLNT